MRYYYLENLLMANGYELTYCNGSQRCFKKPGVSASIVIPFMEGEYSKSFLTFLQIATGLSF